MVEFAGHGVEVVLDDRQPHGTDVGVGAFGEPTAEQAVGLLVGGPPPRLAGFAKVHIDAQGGLDVGPANHLAPSVPGGGLEEVRRLAGERGDRAAAVRSDGRGPPRGVSDVANSSGADRSSRPVVVREVTAPVVHAGRTIMIC